ncbi:MAG: hypothetical protein KA004_17140 [Verrucomicrobiales bacterium]|nr:hypothetical protein [Verrucomicrobiales bacterium]
MNRFLPVSLTILFSASVAAARVWTSAADPEKQFEGDYLGLRDGKILVQLSNGKERAFPKESVCREDQDFVERQEAMAPSERDATKRAAEQKARTAGDGSEPKKDAGTPETPPAKKDGPPDAEAKPPDKSAGAVAAELYQNLLKLDGEKLEAFHFANGKEPKFYLVCFAAKWSDASVKRLPKLAEYYEKTVQPLGSVEMLLYSFDNTEGEQRALITGGKVPFPAVSFQAVEKKAVKLLGKLAGDQLPQFVLVDADGKKLYDQYEEPDAATLKKLTQSREL